MKQADVGTTAAMPGQRIPPSRDHDFAVLEEL
jgi:hypothetical protein